MPSESSDYFRKSDVLGRQNDTFLISQYVEKLELENLFVSCFTTCGDVYHFWKIYASRPTGICVTYNTSKIIEAIKKDIQASEFRFEKVNYENMHDLSRRESPIEEYPFIKRQAFSAEDEYRLIFSSRTCIPLRILKIEDTFIEIILSPTLNDFYLKEYKELISSRISLPSNKIRKSTILESDRWKKIMRY